MSDPGTSEPSRGRGRPTDYRPEYCQSVIDDMAKGYSLTAFAGLIGVSRSTINEWMSAHPEFSEAVSRAKALRLRDWETVALDMRTKGGGPGGATITVFGLKNMGGDEWQAPERMETALSAKVEHAADASFAAVVSALDIAGRTKAGSAGAPGEVDSDGQADAASAA